MAKTAKSGVPGQDEPGNQHPAAHLKEETGRLHERRIVVWIHGIGHGCLYLLLVSLVLFADLL